MSYIPRTVRSPIVEPEPVPEHGFIVSRELKRKRSCGRAKAIEEGHCRLCLRPASEYPHENPLAIRRMTRHHLVPRRWWRHRPRMAALYRDVDANIVPLCRPCHDLVEESVLYRRMLRHVMTQAEVTFCIQVCGKVWLDRRYPLRALTG